LIYSLAASLLIGIIAGIYFTSFWAGLLLATIVFIVVIIANPKRRFFRVACFSLGVPIFNLSPVSILVFEYIRELLPIKLHPVTSTASPWLNIFLVILAGLLFILDSKQK
jgi:hypothetical protein